MLDFDPIRDRKAADEAFLTRHDGEAATCQVAAGAGEIIVIPLHDRSGSVVAHAIVDAADCKAADFRWHRTKSNPRSQTFYVCREIAIDGKRTKQYLHYFVLGLTVADGKQIDHKNRNGLDCRRSNLRVATLSQNAHNAPVQKKTSRRYKGVSWCKRKSMWRAGITIHGANLPLGYFASEDDAARAYDKAGLELMGEFCRLNVTDHPHLAVDSVQK